MTIISILLASDVSEVPDAASKLNPGEAGEWKGYYHMSFFEFWGYTDRVYLLYVGIRHWASWKIPQSEWVWMTVQCYERNKENK